MYFWSGTEKKKNATAVAASAQQCSPAEHQQQLYTGSHNECARAR